MLKRAFIALVGMVASPAMAQTTDYDAFGAYLEEFRQDTRTPALSAVIVRDGRIAWEAHLGWSDDEGEEETSAETSFWIASVTKPIAATAIIAESLAGDLDLQTPMAADPKWTDVCDWLSNSGILFGSGGTEPDGTVVAKMDCDRAPRIADMLDMRVNTESFTYNPIAYARLDRVISGAGGRPLREIVRDRVIEPAGMQDVALGWRDPEAGDALRMLARPWKVVDGKRIEQPLPGDDFRAAAGIWTSARQIARFDIAYDAGALIPTSFRDRLVDRVDLGPDGDYRMGWFLEDWRGHRLMWHSGWEEGKYSALYLKVPDRNLTLVVLANTEAVWWDNSLVRAEIATSPIASRFLEEFVQ